MQANGFCQFASFRTPVFAPEVKRLVPARISVPVAKLCPLPGFDLFNAGDYRRQIRARSGQGIHFFAFRSGALAVRSWPINALPTMVANILGGWAALQLPRLPVPKAGWTEGISAF